MRRIGIYGGSFNPPHLGHVLAARNARALLQLGEILFIPAAIPPHKAVAGGSPDGETRLALTELAIAGEPGMSVSRIELDRPGPSYTVDTLRALRESYGQDELFLLMGTDMFLSFFQWREPEAIAKLATPVCMARVRADAALSAALQQQAKAVETAFGVRPIVLQNECLEISSTEACRLKTCAASASPSIRKRAAHTRRAYPTQPCSSRRNTAQTRSWPPARASSTTSPRRSRPASSKRSSAAGSCP